jgi:hypothetical protein
LARRRPPNYARGLEGSTPVASLPSEVDLHACYSLTCGFPFPASLADERRLEQLGKRLMTDLKKNAERMTIRTRDGHQIAYDEFFASRSKPIIDDIDAVLAEHFDFSPEELDMIVNFDAKFRMGGDNGTDDDD